MIWIKVKAIYVCIYLLPCVQGSFSSSHTQDIDNTCIIYIKIGLCFFFKSSLKLENLKIF